MRISGLLVLICSVILMGCTKNTPDESKSKAEPKSEAEVVKPLKEFEVSASNSPLDVAKQLAAKRYAGWTYGSDSKKKQVDCVQFLAEVIAEVAPKAMTEKLRKEIYIDNLEEEERTQGAQGGLVRLLKAKDKRMTGVQNALVGAGIGKAVSPSDVQPGDLIQYWIYLKNGNVMGHAAIVEHVREGKNGKEIQMYGSHLRTKGIATTDFWLPLTGADREVFLVRMSGK